MFSSHENAYSFVMHRSICTHRPGISYVTGLYQWLWNTYSHAAVASIGGGSDCPGSGIMETVVCNQPATCVENVHVIRVPQLIWYCTVLLVCWSFFLGNQGTTESFWEFPMMLPIHWLGWTLELGYQRSVKNWEIYLWGWNVGNFPKGTGQKFLIGGSYKTL